MIKERWNQEWKVSRAGESPMMAAVNGSASGETLVTLPHDAMIHEKRTPSTRNQHQTGFYPGGAYIYTKVFDVPMEWKERTVHLEFEGIYMNSMVYINGDYAGGHPFGYTNFYICADDFLKYGQSNEIRVIANNSAEENSRWYSGSGIYRNVNIMIGNRLHIKEDGVRISTPEVSDDTAVVQIEICMENMGLQSQKVNLETKLSDAAGHTVAVNRMPVTIFAGETTTCRQRIVVDNPLLWSCEEPNLYTCNIRLVEISDKTAIGDFVTDEFLDNFGIRTLALDSHRGLRINGREVKLRGACIHHDNGIIGACTLEKAELRRCRQLKAAGFNCIRSAHQPLSRAMLEACDREGMLVLDELSDCWTRSKNNNDYAQNFSDYWEFDAEQLVAKDFNHPSVIMYITGNEIQEAGTAKGAQLNRRITEKFHMMDHTRYVTVAINGLLAAMDRMGEIMCSIMGISMEEMIQMQAAAASSLTDAPDITDGQSQASSSAGSDEANGMTDLMLGPMADAFAANEIMTDILEEFACVTDLVGYNYLTARHVMEHAMYPDRVILGTETLPADIVRLWKIVRENPHVIGDMTWTGYDYLGEAGAYVYYYDGRHGFMPNWPISVSYAGDIDITGYRRPMSYFREIVYGLRKAPYIAVERLNHYGETPAKTAWMWKDEIASWTWSGYEGKPAVVNVYSNADFVELFINEKSQGCKPAGEDAGYMASFETVYEPGCIRAVSYGADGGCDICELSTASESLALCVEADTTVLAADGADLAYVMVCLIDTQGNINRQVVKEVSVHVEGAGTLQGFGSADPCTENYYDHTTWETYDGQLLAVIRAGNRSGKISVVFTAEGLPESKIELEVK